MSEISDELLDQGILDWWLHQDDVCGPDCRYCEEEAEQAEERIQFNESAPVHPHEG